MKKTEENEIANVCGDVLQLINNMTTKIEVDQNIKNSYYVFLNDTIYLSTRQTSINRKKTRLVLICHECIHSVQSKILQWVNFILANLELILFFLAIVLKYIFKQEFIVPIYVAIAVSSIIVRGALEVDATFKSIGLTKKYLRAKNEDERENIDIHKVKKEMILTFPLFVIALFWFKVLRLFILLI